MTDHKSDALRIVVADDEPLTRMDIKEILEAKNYAVVGEAADGFDTVAICKEKRPDLVLLDIKMPLLDGFSAAKMIIEGQLADSVILLTAYSNTEFIEKAKALGVAGYLVKPIDERAMIPSIEVALAYSQKMKQLRIEKETVELQLESRKLIEKAKGYIMQEMEISEDDAYQYIKELSKKKNISMKKVSEMILLRYGGLFCESGNC